MNGALWLIIVLLANIIGLIVYLVVREPEKSYPISAPSTSAPYCKYCGNPLTSDANSVLSAVKSKCKNSLINELLNPDMPFISLN